MECRHLPGSPTPFDWSRIFPAPPARRRRALPCGAVVLAALLTLLVLWPRGETVTTSRWPQRFALLAACQTPAPHLVTALRELAAESAARGREGDPTLFWTTYLLSRWEPAAPLPVPPETCEATRMLVARLAE